MPVPGWFRGKLRSRSKPKPGAAAVSSAASSPSRKSVDLDYPSPSPTPRAREKARSLDSPAARHGRGGAEFQYKLPVPVISPEPLCEEATDVAGCSSASGSSVCSSPDDAPDHQASRSMDPIAFAKGRDMPSDTAMILNEDKRFMSCSMPREHHKFFEAPVSNMRALHVHNNDDPSTSEASCSRGRMLTEDIFGPRTRSPSPGRKAHAFAVNNVHSKEFGFSPRSPLKMSEGLRSPPHPLPLPPAPGACSPLPPSPTACSPLPPSPTACSPLPTSPTACSQSQSRWKKGKLLGSGTFGQVYLGFNSENGQFCAIKEVQVISDDPHSKERLKQLNQEIDMLKKASHPNVVQYYDSDMSYSNNYLLFGSIQIFDGMGSISGVGVIAGFVVLEAKLDTPSKFKTDETLSIYLEFVSGGSIHKLLREYGPFKEPVIRSYTGQILAGLAYLHAKNTVHRDIKGANILVGPNGDVKLADFGMAKHISSFAEIRSFKGSPYWMAPEVIMNSKGYNLAVDIWSLGCTIIEMATARPPWHQYEGVAAIFKIANSKDTPEIPDIFSEDGRSFLKLCLKRNPASRATASQLMDHPFVQDHPAVRAAKDSALRNAFSAPADVKHTMV
ncbi:Mitogen-activated protein kinase kinase kinase 2 [Triticum urartu]|uniref:mitogen-activated protein kinase kinase kinase n=1 Tax=Triticum urartu TaxID=4572 RepID=M7YS04_TRIUA|nr:Mitogen-activated protein kinase kinase kinase 2 [Triticum urartu]